MTIHHDSLSSTLSSQLGIQFFSFTSDMEMKPREWFLHLGSKVVDNWVWEFIAMAITIQGVMLFYCSNLLHSPTSSNVKEWKWWYSPAFLAEGTVMYIKGHNEQDLNCLTNLWIKRSRETVHRSQSQAHTLFGFVCRSTGWSTRNFSYATLPNVKHV